MYKFKNKIEPFAVGYLQADRLNQDYKIACAMLENAKYKKIYIDPSKLFAGNFDPEEHVGVKFSYGNGIQVDTKILDEEINQFPQYKDELELIKKEMAPLDTYYMVREAMSELQKAQIDQWFCHGGDWGGHSNPIYLLSNGTNGLKRKIAKYRKANAGNDDFYDALDICIEALETLAVRYKKLAEDMAITASEIDKKRLLKIADAFENIPKNEPGDFFEACQMFWLLFTFDGIDSPGRFDHTMIKYYRSTPMDERIECLDALWQLFYETRTWNLCIGGSDENYNDQTNELTYDILDLVKKYRYNTPNLTMRVHRNTPQRLIDAAIETISVGTGMPVLYNDECVCPALEALGIPAVDSHKYCLNGCNQIDIYGKSHMGLEDGEVCLAKCLQLALNGGICSITGKQLGPDTGDAASFSSYNDLFDAYIKQVEAATDSTCDMANKAQEIYANYAPNPYRSLIIDGCIEKGKDYKNGGPLYCHGQILAEGIADTVDSLAAVKHFVYDTKKYTMSELISALNKDFAGSDELYNDFLRYKKFGNNSMETDEIYKKVTEHFYKYLLTKKTFRGGIYGGGCSPFNRAAFFGTNLGAMPNGRKSNSTLLADSIGSVPGEDVTGATALLNSVLSVDQTLAKSGHILNLKFNKNVFASDDGKNAFEKLVKAYFTHGGQQLSVSVVSAEEFCKAQQNPKLYKNLIVRVGGYSDYFVNLSPELQNNIIKRTTLMS